MTVGWLKDLDRLVNGHGKVVRVSVIAVDGSAPRGVGTFMMVTETTLEGTIGGGALENEALMASRHMLAEDEPSPWCRWVREYPLGPDLGQCCGGYVRLLYEVFGKYEIEEPGAALAAAKYTTKGIVVRPVVSGQPAMIVTDRKDFSDQWPLALRRNIRDMASGVTPCQPALMAGDQGGGDEWYVDPLEADLIPLYLYGAGHVGRAVVHSLKGLPFQINWIDTEDDRFPGVLPQGVRRIVTKTPEMMPAKAVAGAYHVVMTFSHVIDFEICRAVLSVGNFAYLGLIGSKTKRARFAKRLRDAGLGDSWIDQLHSPIGLPGLEGKEPAVIAVSLAADLLLRLSAEAISVENPLPGALASQERGAS